MKSFILFHLQTFSRRFSFYFQPLVPGFLIAFNPRLSFSFLCHFSSLLTSSLSFSIFCYFSRLSYARSRNRFRWKLPLFSKSWPLRLARPNVLERRMEVRVKTPENFLRNLKNWLIQAIGALNHITGVVAEYQNGARWDRVRLWICLSDLRIECQRGSNYIASKKILFEKFREDGTGVADLKHFGFSNRDTNKS